MDYLHATSAQRRVRVPPPLQCPLMGKDKVMTTTEMINAICKEILFAGSNDRIDIPADRQPISVYGPVAAVKKSFCYGEHPLELLIQEGPDEFYWTRLSTTPEQEYLLTDLYRAVCAPVRQKKPLKCRVVNF